MREHEELSQEDFHVHEHVLDASARPESGLTGASGVTPVPGSAGVSRPPTNPTAVLSMQRLAGNAAVAKWLGRASEEDEKAKDKKPDASQVLSVVGKGGGQPLSPSIKSGMEKALDADLSDVRIHDDTAASASAEAVKARAYTVGNDVVFQSGLYQPDTTEGQKMLAHELTHVVQQRQGPVDGTPTGHGVAVSDPQDRFERAAEANADRIMSSGLVGAGAGGPAVDIGTATSGAGAAQRDLDEEEEDVAQGVWLQRDADEDEADQEEEEDVTQGLWLQRDDDGSSAASPTTDPNAGGGSADPNAAQPDSGLTADDINNLFDTDGAAANIANVDPSELEGAGDLAPDASQSQDPNAPPPTAQAISVQALTIQRDPPAAPAPPAGGGTQPPPAGGDTQTKPGSPGDVLKAVSQVPAVKQALDQVKQQFSSQFTQLKKDPVALSATAAISVMIAAGVVGGVASDPTTRNAAINFAFGKDVPLPIPPKAGGVPLPGLSFKILGQNTQATGVVFTLDVGKALGWQKPTPGPVPPQGDTGGSQ